MKYTEFKILRFLESKGNYCISQTQTARQNLKSILNSFLIKWSWEILVEVSYAIGFSSLQEKESLKPVGLELSIGTLLSFLFLFSVITSLRYDSHTV